MHFQCSEVALHQQPSRVCLFKVSFLKMLTFDDLDCCSKGIYLQCERTFLVTAVLMSLFRAIVGLCCFLLVLWGLIALVLHWAQLRTLACLISSAHCVPSWRGIKFRCVH